MIHFHTGEKRGAVIAALVTLVAVAAAAAIIISARMGGWTIFLSNARADWVVRVGDASVSAPEYLVYLYEQKVLFEDVGGEDIWDTDFDGETPEEVAKRNALRRVETVKKTAAYCVETDVSLSEERKLEADESATELFADMPRSLKDEGGVTVDIVKKVAEDMGLYEMTYEFVTKNYILNERDFESYFSDYIENGDALSSEEAMEDLEKIKEVVRDEYIITTKNEMFDAECAEWSQGVKTVVNKKALARISVFEMDGGSL
ncbi:MAG: hypothetical protein LBL35_07770 [Clostridiales bacterium]|nr:hypothetical protein [Clostridiales bacterium]